MVALELAWTMAGAHYVLEGRLIHPGDLLEASWTEDLWHPLRFEWTGAPTDHPRFFVGPHDVTDRLPIHVRFRRHHRAISP